VVVAAAARGSAQLGHTVHIGSCWASAGTREPVGIRQ
jgi:hypothetical protein